MEVEKIYEIPTVEENVKYLQKIHPYMTIELSEDARIFYENNAGKKIRCKIETFREEGLLYQGKRYKDLSKKDKKSLDLNRCNNEFIKYTFVINGLKNANTDMNKNYLLGF